MGNSEQSGRQMWDEGNRGPDAGRHAASRVLDEHYDGDVCRAIADLVAVAPAGLSLEQATHLRRLVDRAAQPS